MPGLMVRGQELPASVWVLLAVNAFPLFGVLFLHWDLGVILLLYWAESAVILVFSLIKVAETSGKAAIAIVPFFIVHAGMFMGVHLLFLVALFVHEPAGGWGAWARDLGIGVAAFSLSHGMSFITNHRGRDEKHTEPGSVMSAFYGRIVVMHLTIIGGAFLIGALGSPVWALGLLVVLKTAVDAAAHLRERRTRAAAKAAGWTPVDS